MELENHWQSNRSYCGNDRVVLIQEEGVVKGLCEKCYNEFCIECELEELEW